MSGKRLRFLQGALFAFAGLLALLLVVRWEENWRGARALVQAERELRAAGESLELRSFLPPPVPDAENFAAAPIVQQLLRIAATRGDRKLTPEEERLEAVSLTPKPSKPGLPGRGDWLAGEAIDLSRWAEYLDKPSLSPDDAPVQVIAALARFTPELSDFAEAAARPAAVFPANYHLGLQFKVHHFFILTRFAEIYGLRGAALLHAGRSDLAFRDLQTLFRLQAALQREPSLISFLVRHTLWHFYGQLLWEGLAEHAWKEAELQQIDELLQSSDWRADYAHAIRGERAFSRICYAQLRASDDGSESLAALLHPWVTFPPLWMRLLRILPGEAILAWNEARQLGVSQKQLGWIDAGQIAPRKFEELERVWERRRTTPYNMFVKETVPIQSNVLRRAATAIVATEEARTACAIERFRLRNGRLPESLSALVPDYLPRPPADPLGNGALQFRAGPEGCYRIYSFGWNGTDEGGEVAFKSGGKRRDDKKGDWVWRSGPR